MQISIAELEEYFLDYYSSGGIDQSMFILRKRSLF